MGPDFSDQSEKFALGSAWFYKSSSPAGSFAPREVKKAPFKLLKEGFFEASKAGLALMERLSFSLKLALDF